MNIRIVSSFVCSVLTLHIVVAVSHTSTVETEVGTFNGHVRKFKAFDQDFTVRRFFGIPYAEPPIGDRRFKKPVKKAKLEQPYDATKHQPSCMQQKMPLVGSRKPGRFDDLKISEDCLYLNIYTPEDAGKSGKLLPVMIYIHGGGFVFGTPTLCAQDIISAYGNVVAVTIAYRLSIWGFLSTGDESLPGNYGLWDQHMAIQWVHDNIEQFGGDPNSVTLYGTSAGGASVVYQGLFPGNQGLIHRVISQSGSVTAFFAFNENPLPATKKLARLAGCVDNETTKKLAECLKSKSSEDLYDVVTKDENGFVLLPYDFIPCADDDFLSVTPTEIFHGHLMSSRKYRHSFDKLDLMIGITEGDGLLRYSMLFNVSDPDTYVVTRDTFQSELVPEIVQTVFGTNAPTILSDIVIGEYTNWDNPDEDTEVRESFVKLATDYFFGYTAIETARVHAPHSEKNTYVFLYGAFPSQHLFAVPSWANKAQHVDEMTTLLGYDNEDGYTSWTTPYTDDPPADWELELSKAHIKLWTNFARTGNPNGPANVKDFMKTVWPTYNLTSEQFITIAREMSEKSVGQRLLARETNFWLNILPGVIKSVKGDYKSRVTAEEEFCERDKECKP